MNPLRRPIAAVGLVALTVIAWLAFQGELGLGEAGLRAGVVLLFVRFLDKVSAWWLRSAAMAAARVSSRGQILSAEAAAQMAQASGDGEQ